MTSLAGCAGEDFASILRALGYRMETRPKPAEEPLPTAAAAETAPSEDASADAIAPAMPAVEMAPSEATAATTADAAELQPAVAVAEAAPDECGPSPRPVRQPNSPPVRLS